MSTVQPTDKVLVQRATTLHSAPADMSTVQDTDLILINRAGVDYKCSVADWKASQRKPPAIASVTLADSPEAGRFTSGTFKSTVVMTDEGIPASTKGIKAYVEGTLKSAAMSSAITAVGTDTVALPSSSWRAVVGSLANPTGAFNGKLSTTSAGGGDNATVASGANGQLEGNFAPAIAFGKTFALVALVTSSSAGHNTVADAVVVTLSDGSTHNITSTNTRPPGALPEFWLYTYTGSGSISKIDIKGAPGFSCGLDAILVDGVMLKDGMTVTKLTLTDSTNLSSFAAGDAVTESGNGNDGTGAIRSVDATANTITLSTQQPNWDVGSQVKGPLKAAPGGASVKLFCKLNPTLTVTDLQSADPGYTAVTGAGPYTVTFPATLPSGNASDVDLPAGTSLTTEVQASNSSATVHKASNTLIPA